MLRTHILLAQSVTAGLLKRHMRQMHQIPCLPEGMFNPLRDSVDGTSMCRHCMIHFSIMLALRAHINKRICTAFDMHQALVIPIVSRAEVAMHIHHQSYMGLMLDKPLCQELATHYVFCNQQVHAKAMTRHSRDQHQEKIGPTNTHMTFVNFGSGRSECPLSCTKSFTIQTHHCNVVFQFAAMTAHVFESSRFPVMPSRFPVMPCMKRVWHPAMASGTDQIPEEVPLPAPTAKKPPTPKFRKDQRKPQHGMDHYNPGPAMYRCSQCPAIFLFNQGLTQHQLVHQTPETIMTSRGRPPGKDTIPKRLAESASTKIPIPVNKFACPLCLEMIRRKALAAHLRPTHQVDKPNSFPFRPNRDMTPERICCIHCRASFTMPFAFQNHFSRDTCPQFVIQWVRDQHFGSIAPPQTALDPPMPRRASDPPTMVLGIKTTGIAPDCADLIHVSPMI